MAPVNEEKIVYLETPVPNELTLAAASVPVVLGFDRDEGGNLPHRECAENQLGCR